MASNTSSTTPAMEFYQKLWGDQIGTVKLQPYLQKYLQRGLIVAIILHLLLILFYFGILWLTRDDEFSGRVIYFDASMLGPPPSLSNQAPPPTLKIDMPQVAPPVAAKPVAVEDTKAPEQQTIQSQDELKVSNNAPVSDHGDSLVVPRDLDIIPNINEFTPYEKPPIMIPGKNPRPTYPEMARKSGLPAKVSVKIYVDKKGDVRKAEIIKADPKGFGFEDEVMKVIYNWKFEPAIQNNEPVGVWVVYPFNFKVGD